MERLGAHAILRHFSFWIKVGKPISNLFIRIHTIVDYPKTFI